MIDGEGAATGGGGRVPSFGVVVPAFGPLAARAAFNDAVDTIEGLGFDDVWFGDHVAVPSYAAHLTRPEWLEPLSACMLALGRTSRLRAGTDVLVLPYRDPLLVAKMASTADVLSGGRLVLGIGVGYLKGEFEALGADYGRRGAVTDEYLTAMRALWGSAGAPTSFDTEFVRFNDVCMGPPPTTGQVPVWVGGNARGALRRAALMGDGWHPLFPTPDRYRSGRDAIVAWRGSADRFVFSISLAVTRVLQTGETYTPRSWGEEADIPEDFGYSPPVPLADDGRPRFVGHPDQLAADVEAYAAAGVEHFTLRFSVGDDVGVADYFDQLQRFADHVMARFSVSSPPLPPTDPPPSPPARDRILTMTSHGTQRNRS
jgi:probable F420-dependent oxidoreductase